MPTTQGPINTSDEKKTENEEEEAYILHAAQHSTAQRNTTPQGPQKKHHNPNEWPSHKPDISKEEKKKTSRWICMQVGLDKGECVSEKKKAPSDSKNDKDRKAPQKWQG